MPELKNPYRLGSVEAAEWDYIVARLADPAQERRLARALADADRALPELDVIEHAAHAEQLAAAGVIFGPDCSQFQGHPNWGSVKAAGCGLGGYKVSEGMTYTDPSHAYNKAAVPAAGLVPIAYHYMSPTSPAAAQADYFASLVDPHAWHQLDVEAASSAGLDVVTWVGRYFTHFPDKTLGVYSNHGMWTVRSHVHTGVPSGRVVTWHAGRADGTYTTATGSLTAQWANTSSLLDSMQQLGFPPARLWQFTDDAQVPGISGTCDGNAFLGTLNDLRALATGATDDMSAADVTAITTHIDQALRAARDDFAAAAKTTILGANLGASGPTVGVALQSGFQLAQKIQAQTDSLETSEAAEATTLGQLQAALTALPDAIVAKLPTTSGGGGVDAATVKAAVVEALAENLPTTFVAQPRQ